MTQRTMDIHDAPVPAQLVFTDRGYTFLRLTRGWNNSLETIRRCLPRGWGFYKGNGPYCGFAQAPCVALLGHVRTSGVFTACEGHGYPVTETKLGFGHWYCFPVERVE